MNLKAFRVSKIFLSYSELASKNKKVECDFGERVGFIIFFFVCVCVCVSSILVYVIV